jgi:transcriptional regulator with GAF, ATPase, and Fis domain
MNEQMISLLEKLERIRELERENTALKVRLQDRDRLEGMIGSSKAMREVFKCVKTIAPTSSSILIQGETGTGKEVIARAIHSHSNRAKHPMVALSCAAVPPTLLEDELFGHDVGAFTDARDKKLGRIERADKGTFFLDDIDDMPLEIQVKLLRVLQEREFERLGGDTTISVDVRIITATKVSLRDMVNEGKFREDLFYRLNVVPLLLPPLRDRQGDVTLLVQHFIEKYGNGRAYEVKEDVRAAMDAYYWPGNIRELEHAVERAIAFAGAGRILKREHLVEASTQHKKALAVPPHLTTLKEFTEEAERQHIIETLRTTNGHKAQAAGVLGISRKNLWEKMRLYEIEVD